MKKQLTRDQAIGAIRAKLMTLVDDEHSICEVATRLGIFCGGFSGLKTGELRERYDWIVRNAPWIRRKELEDVANRWQLVRQSVLGMPLACDTQSREREAHRTCAGWPGFSNERLEGFHRDLLNEEIEIVDAPREACA